MTVLAVSTGGRCVRAVLPVVSRALARLFGSVSFLLGGAALVWLAAVSFASTPTTPMASVAAPVVRTVAEVGVLPSTTDRRLSAIADGSPGACGSDGSSGSCGSQGLGSFPVRPAGLGSSDGSSYVDRPVHHTVEHSGGGAAPATVRPDSSPRPASGSGLFGSLLKLFCLSGQSASTGSGSTGSPGTDSGHAVGVAPRDVATGLVDSVRRSATKAAGQIAPRPAGEAAAGQTAGSSAAEVVGLAGSLNGWVEQLAHSVLSGLGKLAGMPVSMSAKSASTSGQTDSGAPPGSVAVGQAGNAVAPGSHAPGSQRLASAQKASAVTDKAALPSSGDSTVPNGGESDLAQLIKDQLATAATSASGNSGSTRPADAVEAGGSGAGLSSQNVDEVLSPAVDLVSGIVSVLGGQRAGAQTHQALAGVAREVSSALALGNALNNAGSRGSDHRTWNALSSRPGQERSETAGLTGGGHSRTGASGGLWAALAADRATGAAYCDRDRVCGPGGGIGLDRGSSAGARAPPALTSGHHSTTPSTTDDPTTSTTSRNGLQLPLSDGGTLGVTPIDSPSRDASITPDEANGRYLITAQDAQASNDYHFQLSTPAGSHAVVNRDGGVDLVNPDGQVTQAIAAPWAYDAAGKPVPTYFTVQGSTLTQHIQPGPDSIYPILADPAAANTPAPKVGDPGYQGAVHDPDVRDHLDPTPGPAPAKPAPATGTVNSSGVDKVVPPPAPAKKPAPAPAKSSAAAKKPAPAPKPAAAPKPAPAPAAAPTPATLAARSEPAPDTGTVNSQVSADREPAPAPDTGTVNSQVRADRKPAPAAPDTGTVNSQVPADRKSATPDTGTVNSQVPADQQPGVPARTVPASADSTVNSSQADPPTHPTPTTPAGTPDPAEVDYWNAAFAQAAHAGNSDAVDRGESQARAALGALTDPNSDGGATYCVQDICTTALARDGHVVNDHTFTAPPVAEDPTAQFVQIHGRVMQTSCGMDTRLGWEGSRCTAHSVDDGPPVHATYTDSKPNPALYRALCPPEDGGCSVLDTGPDQLNNADQSQVDQKEVDAGVGIDPQSRHQLNDTQAQVRANALTPDITPDTSLPGPGQKLPWLSWDNYPKTTVNGREYAMIGNRLYPKHVVDRMAPPWWTTTPTGGRNVSTPTDGRSVPPSYVDDAIRSTDGTPAHDGPNGEPRLKHVWGDLTVITEDNDNVVVTVIATSPK